MKTITLICLLCFLPDIQAQQITGIFGESDSTIIGYVVYGTDTLRTRYTFDKEHYRDASFVIQCSQIGYANLNIMAQKEYNEKLKYIKGMESIR